MNRDLSDVLADVAPGDPPDDPSTRRIAFIAPKDYEHQTIEELKVSVPQRQVMAAQEFALSGRRHAAMIKAGYAHGSSGRWGTELFRRPYMRRLVAYYRTLYCDTAFFDKEKLLKQWSRQASFSPMTLLNDDWSIKRLDAMTSDEQAHLAEALLGVEVVEKAGHRTIRPRFDRMKAQEELGKLLGLYKDEKGQGEGLSLQINIGQQTRASVTEGDDGEHLTIDLTGEASDD